ncbi:MAG: fumarylacetoacetate hydrolase family protein [Candidatus Hodarchaeota archaeon]
MIELPIQDTDAKYKLKPSKIIALGLNYEEHINESASVKAMKNKAKKIPKEPVLFPKTPNSLIGPGDAIVIPEFLLGYNFPNLRVDYEAELAFIINKNCKNVTESEAMDQVLGFMALNDVSQRNLQLTDRSGWFRGKSLDTFCPVGPEIVPLGLIDDPQNLHIECRLNGETVQDSNTSKMIFSIPKIISFISKNFTLLEGDVISTGTPSGVGPIKHSDVIEVEIESIGILKNPVIEEWKQK